MRLARREKYFVSAAAFCVAVFLVLEFLIFPFFALSRKGLRDKNEVEYREVIEQGDRREERVWNVSAHQKYGYPGPFDREVHKAVECIINEQGWPVQNPVRLGSLYGLCKRMGLKDSGWSKRRIKEALRRNVATIISSENAFYHKGKKRRVTEAAFHLYDGVYFVDQERRITYWNSGAERLTGYRREDVLGKRCSDNILMHINDEGMNLCEKQCPLEETIIDGQPRDIEAYLQHRDGHRVPVSIRVAPVRGAEPR